MEKLYLFLILSIICTTSLPAQQSSKSKSKDRFREKNDEAAFIRVTNTKEVNGRGRETAPVYYKNGLVFVSQGQDFNPKNSNKKEPGVYFSPFSPSGQTTLPTHFDFISDKKTGPIVGGISFSRGYDKALFSIPITEEKSKRIGIAESTESSDGWQLHLISIPGCEQADCIHPFKNPDGTKIFFASNMPGGFGDYDLYVSEYQAGQWSPAKNLGPHINSPGADIYPYLTLDGTLLFSSNREGSLGGLDLYFTNKLFDESVEVENLGEPFNSTQDDYNFVLAASGEKGYFVSKRNGGYGDADIYTFEAKKGFGNTKKPQTVLTMIQAVSRKDKSPIRGALIYIFETASDSLINTNCTFKFNASTDHSNKRVIYLTNNWENSQLGKPDFFSNAIGSAAIEFKRDNFYWIHVQADGYFPQQKFIHIETDTLLTVLLELQEMPAGLREKGLEQSDVLPDHFSEGTILQIQNKIFHDHTSLLNEKTIPLLEALNSILSENPAMEVELTVHMDTDGDLSIKQQISNERAKNLMIYLKSCAKYPDRITAYGNGATQPIRRCTSGDCTEEENRINDRVEIRIIKKR